MPGQFALASLAALLCMLAGSVHAQSPSRQSASPTRTIRLHGLVEPVRSYTVSAPRLTGSATPGAGPSQLIVVRLAKAGTFVKKDEVLVEFDRHSQLRAARDRESEFRDILEQINKKRGEQLAAGGMREAQLKQAENDARIAELGVIGNDLVPKTTAEKNVQTLEEARARLAQLRTVADLKRRAEAADVRMLEIQRDRAANAWKHARRNAEKMRIVAPHDGLVVLKTIWKNGTMAEVQEGEEARPGIPILDIVDPSAMRVRVNANQADIEGLALGQRARITLDSHPARAFNGRLATLSPIATTSSMSNRVRTFVVTFSIEENDEHLLPDLAAAIEINSGVDAAIATRAPPIPEKGQR
jgi:multidrug efflux pump subunit AcrA (membrane-fusion protein)